MPAGTRLHARRPVPEAGLGVHCPWGSAGLGTWQSGEQDTVLPRGSQDGADPPLVAPKPALPLAKAEALQEAPWAGTGRPGAASACAAHH